MIIYRADVKLDNEDDLPFTNDEYRHLNSEERHHFVADKAKEFNRTLDCADIVVNHATNEEITLAIVAKMMVDVKAVATDFIKGIKLWIKSISADEIKINEFKHMMFVAGRSELSDDVERIADEYGLQRLLEMRRFSNTYDEGLIKNTDREKIYEQADGLLSNDSVKEELDRIYEGPDTDRALGHPVHYMIRSDSAEFCKSASEMVLGALYDRKRLESRRYAAAESCDLCQPFALELHEDVYECCEGGTVVIRFNRDADEEDRYASMDRRLIESLCETMRKYRNKVLTVICVPQKSDRIKELFFNYLANFSIVEVKEDYVDRKREREFLKDLAVNDGLKADRSLYAMLEKDRRYLTGELRGVYDKWYDRTLKTKIYPQYGTVKTVQKEQLLKKPKGDAYEELQNMIGLSGAKQIINEAICFNKARALFERNGVKADSGSMHMVFTGNPGTAKTTVARLFARIMKDNGVLSVGDLVEVGRSDLVGMFVGWTAKIVKKKFEEATGSVLFIDEAYSLVDDKHGMFGDEAINTIVQEMENHRDDVIVIFAGYPDRMEAFLNNNPGLRSRIAYHVPFEDYNTEELCRIADLMAEQKGLKLSDGARSKLEEIFEAARSEEDFGNGRYVRNILEKAQKTQAVRLIKMDTDTLTQKEISTICKEDIIAPNVSKKQKISIGFKAVS